MSLEYVVIALFAVATAVALVARWFRGPYTKELVFVMVTL